MIQVAFGARAVHLRSVQCSRGSIGGTMIMGNLAFSAEEQYAKRCEYGGCETVNQIARLLIRKALKSRVWQGVINILYF